ncbi:hypothetical protein [Streptomyces sp. H39-S7]|uniref:hypothetical protein n=1 Tax=Streptomyces sp. H39-S7 TaxID=3004357 RepID=UPI0022B046E3|nr:hypothetical protein [Streptomyces sp. H39-S7]MCZ4125930.1 hypothetical protein [Streptomyces sp. H39-S7]
MLADLRQLERIVGRRAALRYAGIGLVTVAVAACGGKKNSGGSDNKLTVGAVALDAFARGTWKLTITPAGKTHDSYSTITIAAGAWHMDDVTRSGTYSFSAGTLSVIDPKNDNGSDQAGWTGTGVPDQVGKGTSVKLGWSPDPSTDPSRELPVTWDGTTLTLKLMPNDRRRGEEAPVVITAVRA